jgi:hypothetical protein
MYKKFPKNPNNITKDELHEHFDLNNNGIVTLDDYANHIKFHCKNPEVLEEELEEADFDKGFKYAKGGIVWKKNIGDDGWSSTMESESAYENVGGYISENGNWLIHREGKFYERDWGDNFERRGYWLVYGKNEYGQVEDLKGEFETLSEAKKYVERLIEINPEDYAKGGKTKEAKNWKQKYNKKYGNDLEESNSLSEISEDTGVSKKGIQKIYNKGIGAYKTNPSSVRPNVKSKEQWAQARVYSAVMGGKAAKVDAKELKMEKGGMTEKVSAIKKMMAKGGEIEREIYYRIENNYIGWLELGSYTTNRGVPNVSLKFTQAMNNLFDYLKSEDGIYSSKEYPKSKYAIVKYDTSKKKRGGYTEIDGYAELKENVVFKISAKEVIKMKDEFSFKKGGEVDKHDTKQYYEISFTFEDEAEQSIGGYALNEQEAKELAKKWVNERGYTNLMNVEAEVVEPPTGYKDDKTDGEDWLRQERTNPYYSKGGKTKTNNFKLDWLYNQLKISKKILDNSMSQDEKNMNLIRYDSIQKIINNILVKSV